VSTLSSSFSIDLDKLKDLGISDPRSAVTMDLIRAGSISSDQRLFLTLSTSTLLKTVLFPPKKKILSTGSLVEDGYLITGGSLIAVEGDFIYRLGPGAVLGLAEGVINRPSRMTVVTTTNVQARLIPLHKMDATIAKLPMEVKAILQTIVKRTLGLP
jgi:CRP-like cAMP-binding protein